MAPEPGLQFPPQGGLLLCAKYPRNVAKSRRPAAVLIFLALAVCLALPQPVWAIGGSFGTWTDLVDGRLNTPRAWHTATLLPNGKVLVAGGYGGFYLKSAELFDPATGKWTYTGEMSGARYQHTATLLPNGKVLVAGGVGPTGRLNTAELYDPATGLWSSAGTMSGARSYHTATLLTNGKVLVAGGDTATGFLAEAELYTPDSGAGTWSAAHVMYSPRSQHTATLLQDGRVLVAGGQNGAGRIDDVEIYTADAGSGSWEANPPLWKQRSAHTAVLLNDDRVLVVGGDLDDLGAGKAELNSPGIPRMWAYTADLTEGVRWNHTATLLPNGMVLIAGGEHNGPTYPESKVYDPVTGAWQSAGSTPQSVQGHTATLLPDGRVLLAGGLYYDGFDNYYRDYTQIYDYAAGSWTDSGGMYTSRRYHTLTLLKNGLVLATGGFGGTFPTELLSAELFDPAGNSGGGTWTTTDNLSVSRSNHTATLLANGKVLIVGRNTAELYNPGNPDNLKWEPAGSLSNSLRYHTATLLGNGKVLVTGGQNLDDYSDLAATALYDPDANQWTESSSPGGPGALSTPRVYHTATLLPSGRVLVAGGYYYDEGTDTDYSLASAELFDPATGLWTPTGSMSGPRLQHTATLLPNGKVLVVGGQDGNYNFVVNAELFDPAANGGLGAWSAAGSITGRYDHTATLLPNGKVLVVGGSGSTGPLASVQLYDPGSNSWSATTDIYPGLMTHKATLLASGKVLVAGGYYEYGTWSGSVLFDPGLGFQTAWRPLLNTVPPSLDTGQRLYITGSQFRGLSEASGGATNDSATNYPLVQLRRLDNERTIWLTPNASNAGAMTATSFESGALQNFQTGPCLATVFANGIPSVSKFTVFNNTGPPTAVQLKSFTAAGKTSYVQLNWQTGSEVNTVAFRLWRREGSAQGDYTRNQALIPARGGPSRGAKYSYKDTAVVKGQTYYYQLEDIARTGADSFHGPVSATVGPVKKSRKQAQPAAAANQEAVIAESPAPEPPAPATPKKAKSLSLR
jgi:N-acetylneuraminic acid mutarotase